MSQRSRIEYLERILARYSRAGRKHKKIILDEFCINCGYERKYAIKLLNGSKRGRSRRSGPKAKYGQAEREVLERIWRQSEQICSKRLKIALGLWLPHYEKRYGAIAQEVKRKLAEISPATIDRLLAPLRMHNGRGRCGTRPGNLLKTQIPIRTGYWDVTEAGFLEADTVAHCGSSMAGDFIWTITYTDILSGWTAARAIWNRGAEGVVSQTREVEAHLPFALKGFDCDNGGEFLNWHLVKYFTDRKSPVFFTRSRPYHKDDNAHVEQKNWTYVRQLLGYERFEYSKLVEPINDLYRNEWSLLQNFFCPSMKLLSKERIKSRMVRKFDTPKTPYQRLLAWGGLSKEAETELNNTYERIDPFALSEGIERKLKAIFQLHRNSQLPKVS